MKAEALKWEGLLEEQKQKMIEFEDSSAM